jgi:uncharacterized protein with von Willebrand factor type A (vWA) domain
MVEETKTDFLGTLKYEITDKHEVVVHITLFQSGELFKKSRRNLQKHLCLIIDDSGSMSGDNIERVKEQCLTFGEKFF